MKAPPRFDMLEVVLDGESFHAREISSRILCIIRFKLSRIPHFHFATNLKLVYTFMSSYEMQYIRKLCVPNHHPTAFPL